MCNARIVTLDNNSPEHNHSGFITRSGSVLKTATYLRLHSCGTVRDPAAKLPWNHLNCR